MLSVDKIVLRVFFDKNCRTAKIAEGVSVLQLLTPNYSTQRSNIKNGLHHVV